MQYELSLRGLTSIRQAGLPVTYKGVRLDAGYRLDLLVEKQIIVELKTVASLQPSMKLSLSLISNCRDAEWDC